MNAMKIHIIHHHDTILDWYNSLGRFERKNVKRIGHEPQDTGFWPDE